MVDPHDHVFHFTARRQGLSERVGFPGKICSVLMNGPPAGIEGSASPHLIEGHSQDPFGRRVGAADFAAAVLIDHPQGQRLKQTPKTLFPLPERLFPFFFLLNGSLPFSHPPAQFRQFLDQSAGRLVLIFQVLLSEMTHRHLGDFG